MRAADNPPSPHCNEAQQRAIEAQGECLLLAPPGSGKTFVLTERIRYAHEHGVPYEEMLCLTFTNRAARQMRERIRQHIDDHDAEKVYVGNVHRFCSHFLLNNNVITRDGSIIDDDDVLNIMALFINEEEALLRKAPKMVRHCRTAAQLEGLMRQIEHSHPKALRIHPDCLTPSDIESLQLICKTQGLLFTPSTMLEIYREATDYKSIVKGEGYPAKSQEALESLLNKMELAYFYHNYKLENNLFDFDDILITTYNLLIDEQSKYKRTVVSLYKHYSWCEVDEVQDLNPLQLKIIDLLLVPKDSSTPRTIMYLGDEYQSIYSFMGAR